MKENQAAIGFDPDVFDLVYEGFWDLYMMHEKCDEAPGIKKKTWLARFILQATSPEGEQPEAAAVEGDEGEEEEAKE